MNNIKSTDIYLIDQILKGNFKNFKTILDVGCGDGRNLPYFFENNFEVFGIDPDEKRLLAVINRMKIKTENFKVAVAENIPFSQAFDLIICNAVLHFAKNKLHFDSMLFSIWDRLAANGILFIRLASDIGIEKLIKPIDYGNYLLPDGTIRYLVSQEELLNYTKVLNARLVEPIKTTNVQGLRCMTTWILRK